MGKLFSVGIVQKKESGNSGVSHDWKITNDRFGNAQFSSEEFNQRIRLGRGIKCPVETEEYVATAINDLPGEQSIVVTYKEYDLPSNSSFINNYNNMALMLFSGPKGGKEEPGDIFYIAFDPNIRIFSYSIESECANIVQTFSKKDMYKGCAILVNKKAIPSFYNNNVPIISVSVYDVESGVVSTYYLYYNEETGIHYNIFHNNDPIYKRRLIAEKNINDDRFFFRGFKLTPREGFVTTAFLINPKFIEEDEVSGSFGERIKADEALYSKASITAVSSENLAEDDNGDTISKEVEETLVENFVNKGIRALTLVNINVPKSFCRKYKILYLFSYDPKTNISTCIKSN